MDLKEVIPAGPDVCMALNLDLPGIISKLNLSCFICHASLKIEKGIRGAGKGKGGSYCQEAKQDCPFVITSRRNNGSLGMAPSSAVFKKYGLITLSKTNTYIYGKSHFFYYLYYPSMNWKPPQYIPDFNRMGLLVDKEKDIFTLAHMNGNHYDDSRGNLFFLLPKIS